MTALARFVPALLALLLGACAQAPLKPQDAPAPQAVEAEDDDDDQPGPHAEAAPAPAQNLPNIALTPQIVYQVLLAEIAGQRGNLPLSVSAYLDLAKKTRDPRIARRAAEVAHFARQADAALEASRLWVDIEPESTAARQLIASLLVGLGRTDEAVPHLEVLISKDSANRAEGLSRINRLFSRSTDRQAVLQVIDRLTAPYLDLPEARLARAQAAQAAGDSARALVEIDAVIALKPESEQAVLFKAQLLADKPAGAIETLQRFLAKNPKAREARLYYARVLVGEKRFEDARKEFQKLLADFPDNPDVIYAVGALSYQLNDYPLAEKNFLKLADSDFREVNTVRLYLGQIAETRKQPEQALKWYLKVGEGEQFLTAQLRYANVLAKEGRLDEARRHLQQVSVPSNRDRLQLLVGEAHLLRDAGRNQEAFELLDTSAQAQPNNHDLLYEAALMAERVGRHDVLESNLRRAIQIKPDYAHAYNALGYSFADRNLRLDEAQDLIQKALQYAPDDPFILDSMGWVLYRKGQLDEALKYLQRAFSLRQDPEIAAHLGEVLWAMGRKDEAKRTWRDAEKANPGNEVLANAIKRYIP